MVKNYFTTALRNFRKHPGFTMINGIGLSLGIGCCILILLWIQDELSYDRFHSQANQIFRVTNRVKNSFIITTPGLLGEKLKEEMPAVLDVTNTTFSSNEVIIRQGEDYFTEDGLLYVDVSFLRIFHFPLTQGSDSLALLRPFSVVLSREMADKYFPNQNPLGERLELADGTSYEVTGVLAELPPNSTLQFQFLVSAATLVSQGRDLSGWEDGLGVTYMLTWKGYTADQLSADIRQVIERNNAPSAVWEFTTMALPDIHLHSDLKFSDPEGVQGNIQYVYIFASVGIFILLIACINFINMATARALERTKEVGVRKALGALRKQLVTQFMSESLLMVGGSTVLGYLLAYLLLPPLNSLSQKAMELNPLGNPFLLLSLIALIPLITLLAGLYPSLVLSAFRPAKVLKGNVFHTGRSNTLLRQGLMTVQFVTSAILVISTLVMWQQLDYIRNKNLGFDKEQTILIKNRKRSFEHFAPLKNALLPLPGVMGVSSAPMMGFNTVWPIKADSSNQLANDLNLYAFNVDEDFIDLLDVAVAQGRPFNKESEYDRQNTVILNAKAVEALALDQPIGAQVEVITKSDTGGFYFKEKEVIGVLAEQVNFHGSKSQPKSLILQVSENNLSDVLIKISTENISGTLAAIHRTWNTLDTGIPFDYTFLDDAFDNLYRQDRRVGTAFIHFAVVAILIATLGLIGLSAYTLKRRTKEVGIRKVLGASVGSIMVLLSRDYIRLVLISLLIAIPLANYFIQDWLREFAFQVEIRWWLFAIPSLLVLLITLLAVSAQTLKAAQRNPVDSLRDE